MIRTNPDDVNNDAPSTEISEQLNRIFLLAAHKHLGLDALDVPLRNAFEAVFKAGALFGVTLPKATEAELAGTDLSTQHF